MTSVLPGDLSMVAPPGERLGAAMQPALEAHLSVLGPLPGIATDAERGATLAEVERSGLTGRGGAGFPTARKLAAVAAGRDPVVVANGAEGEPLSRKDQLLLDRAPQLVLDGLQVAAAVTGARSAYAYLPASARPRILAALAERRRTGLGQEVAVTVVTAPDSFIAGQESAVVAAIEGARPLPRDTPELVVRRGVHGRPTLVQNVETLAQLGLIARFGGAWFRELGTPDQPGTFLATINGAVTRPGVVEVPYGVSLGDLIARAGGATERLRAVLVGGYHGVWLPPEALSAPVSTAGLSSWGAAPGAGVVLALGESESGFAAAARIAAYLADQGARQCGPCLNGLPAIATALGRLAEADARSGTRDPQLVAQTAWLTRVVEGRGACHHPDGTARMVRSALEVFGR